MVVRWHKGMRWGLIVIVVAALGAALLPGASAQGNEVERVRFLAQQWLMGKLGKPGLILIEYTFSGASWPDSSLGCPVEGESYTEGTVHGYSWSFLFDNMVRYEVHSSLDGTQHVLCSSISASPDVQLTTYATTSFTLPIPEAWLWFPNADLTEVLFAPQQQLACDQPGARVTVLGRVASGVTPDSLLDDQLAAAGVEDQPTGRATVGSFGRTTLYQKDCGNLTQQFRLGAFVQYGSAYLVEQWAPQGEYARWADPFLTMLEQFGPGDSALDPAAINTGDTAAEAGEGADGEAAPPPLAALPLAHLFVNDLFLGTLDSLPGRSVTNAPTVERRHLTFSPDGLYLAFIDVTHAKLRTLHAIEGRSPRLVSEAVDVRFPPAWSPDSQRVAFALPTDDPATVELHAAPALGGEAQRLGALSLAGDCPTETVSDPASRAYSTEAGLPGRDQVLVWLPGDLFLVSTRCDGGIGVLSLADGSITELGGDLLSGAISPDLGRFLARTAGGLAVLDFTTWQRTDWATEQPPQQIAWGADGQRAYYATAESIDSVTLEGEANAERGEAVFGAWPVTVEVYDLALVRIDLTSGEQQVIWEGRGRGIGRITAAPDGSGVLFSVIPDSLPLVEVFQAGADPRARHELWPVPALYWLGASESEARLLAYAGQPAFAPVTVAPPAGEAATEEANVG